VAKNPDLIEPIDASFEDVLNAVAPKVSFTPKIGLSMKTPVGKELVWSKKLSKTDAQRETSGGLVPYLRLTRSKLSPAEDWQTWFRDKFFAGQNWQPGTYGRETDIETCKVAFDVTIQGLALGKVSCEVTHGPHRWESNNTPNTWVHWPQKIQDFLHLNDLSGLPVKLTRHPDGRFSMALGS
jgi:hypothetical protein